MERLLADAQKVSGVKYDISNLSDVYAAIHVIQGEMDITGTTAKEAAGTLSGSFASMKAAAQDVMGNLTLGRDIGPSLQGLAQTVSDFLVGNLLPALWNILKGLPAALAQFVTAMIPQITGLLQQILTVVQGGLGGGLSAAISTLLTTLVTELPQIFTLGFQIVQNLAMGILQNLPEILTTAGTLLTSFLGGILEMLPQILEGGVQLLLSLVQGIVQNLPEILGTAAQVIAQLLAGIATHLPEILQQGIALIGQLIAGLIQAIPDLIMSIPTIIMSIVKAFAQYDWLSIGGDIIEGIGKGISSAAGAIKDAALNAAKKAFDAVKEFFGINSPSRLMRYEIGQWIPAGVARGIAENTAPLTQAMDEMARKATGTLQADLHLGIDQSTSGTSGTLSQEQTAQGGYRQEVNITSPVALTPWEIARQTRNATRGMVLALNGV